MPSAEVMYSPGFALRIAVLSTEGAAINDDPPRRVDCQSLRVVELPRFAAKAAELADEIAQAIGGLQAVRASRPDNILLDIIMPRLDGFGVIEKLRANPQTRDLPIVVLSAKELTATESARLKETVSGVMKKQGLEGERLVDEIDQALRRSLPARKAQGD